jgi:hypothetical protein
MADDHLSPTRVRAHLFALAAGMRPEDVETFVTLCVVMPHIMPASSGVWNNVYWAPIALHVYKHSYTPSGRSAPDAAAGTRVSHLYRAIKPNHPRDLLVYSGKTGDIVEDFRAVFDVDSALP